MVLRLCENKYCRIHFSSATLSCLCDVTKAIDAFRMTRTVSLVSLCLKQKRIHRSYSTFSLLTSLVEQRTDESLGGIPSKKFFQQICTNWKNSPKPKWEGGNFSLLPPLAAPLHLTYEKSHRILRKHTFSRA